MLSYFPGSDIPVGLSPDKDLSKVKSQPVPSVAAGNDDVLLPPEGTVKTQDGKTDTSKFSKNNLIEEKVVEVMEAHEEVAQTEGKEQ